MSKSYTSRFTISNHIFAIDKTLVRRVDVELRVTLIKSLVMLSDTLIKYCGLFLRKVKKSDIRIFLESSPQYPNLLSVLQTLSYANVNSQIGQCDWDYLKNLESPFLLHANLKSQETLIISKWDTKSNCLRVLNPKSDTWEAKSKENLMGIWDGVVIYTSAHIIRTRFSENKRILLSILIFVAVVTYAILEQWGIPFIYALPVFWGFVASLCLYWRINISEIDVIDRICHKTQIIDCYAVENSPYSVWKGISISSMSLSYFISQLICVIISFVFGRSTILYTEYLFSVVIFIPIASYSLYGQVSVRKICPLCMMVLICVFSEALIYVLSPKHSVNLELLIVLGIIYICVLCVVHFKEHIHQILQEQLAETIQLLKLKRKTEVILLESASVGQVKTLMWFGDENSAINITTIISPSCRHCQNVLVDILSLIEKGIKFRWNIVLGRNKIQDAEEIDMWVQEYFSDKNLFYKKLRLWSNNQIRSLSYRSRPIARNEKILKTCRDFDRLIERLNIQGFPRIILNDRFLSNIYTIKDLEFIITDMSCIEENYGVIIEK